MALSFYQKGCKPLHNLNDSFIIVYYRYLSLKKVQSEKYNYLNKNSNQIKRKILLFV